jgi:hypothetical protein
MIGGRKFERNILESSHENQIAWFAFNDSKTILASVKFYQENEII